MFLSSTLVVPSTTVAAVLSTAPEAAVLETVFVFALSLVLMVVPVVVACVVIGAATVAGDGGANGELTLGETSDGFESMRILSGLPIEVIDVGGVGNETGAEEGGTISGDVEKTISYSSSTLL